MQAGGCGIQLPQHTHTDIAIYYGPNQLIPSFVKTVDNGTLPA